MLSQHARTPRVIANWKMHGSPAMLREYMPQVPSVPGVELVLCPPALLAAQAVVDAPTHLRIGVQDVHPQAQGAHTGDISAELAAALGVRYAIVGHSERRAAYQEHDAMVAAKALAALQAGLIPVICIGETLEERASGRAETVVGASLQEIIPVLAAQGSAAPVVLAYEPIWAIGTGKVPTVEDVVSMHRHIRQTVQKLAPTLATSVSVLYGGSVKPDNASSFAACDGVDGFLVGGASLQAPQFVAIARAVASVACQTAA